MDRWLAHRPERARPRERERRPGGGAGALGELIALFQPGVRHLHEEQERQRHDVVLPGDADPPWDVDLDHGTARMTAPRVPGRELVDVAPGVWVTTAVRWASTTTLVVAPDGRCLVVDPGLTAAEIEGVADEIAARGWTASAGFSTHPHWDHLLWTSRLGSGPRWATADAVEAARSHRATLLSEADAEAPGHDHTLTGRLTALPAVPGPSVLPWTGRQVMVVPYRGHCAGSAALLVPDAGVLVAGDVLSDTEIPLLDLDADGPVTDYRTTLDELEALISEHGVTVVVPGHGAVAVGPEVARRFAADRAYLAALGAADVDDPRLASAEMAALHEAQQRALSR
jgi:glyoxylase-like metal-dependent hydrolase (beta-lactamase superfamily II)